MDRTTTSPPLDDVLAQLEEKDQLIQTLTERLSEVAEQLDRAQRSGGERGGRSAGSSEVLEQQRQLMQSLSEVVELWDGLQPRDAFHRIEARLDHMRDLLEAVLDTDSHAEDSSSKESRLKPAQANPPQREEPAKAQPASGWEAMKAQLLGGQVAATAPVSHVQKPADTPTDAFASAEVAAATPDMTSADSHLSSLLQLPQPVDFETAQREDLEQAVEVRDHFIGVLARRLRSEQHRTREAIHWEALNNAPEDLRTRLQSLEADLEDRLRIAEVELSLERARLSRVQSRVEDMQRQIEARMKNSRPQAAAASAAEGKSAADSESSSTRSWLNSLRRR